MDRVDEIELRSKFIEEDLLHIDEQIQDMNTRIIFVEEDDSLDERIYNNENDIVLINEEVERISTEWEELKEEVSNIEVGGGSGGTPTNEKDTGWRLYFEDSLDFRTDVYICVRRKGDKVEVRGEIANKFNIANNITRDYQISFNKNLTGNYGFPDM